jgi:hypothetical protein
MFRFTIRDVLWFTVVVAMACGWFTDHRRLTSQWDVGIDPDGISNPGDWIDPAAGPITVHYSGPDSRP